MCQESVHLWAAKGVRIFCHLSPLAKFAHIKQQYSVVYVPGLITQYPDYISIVSYVT
jgi:hypothetical protein